MLGSVIIIKITWLHHCWEESLGDILLFLQITISNNNIWKIIVLYLKRVYDETSKGAVTLIFQILTLFETSQTINSGFIFSAIRQSRNICL